MTIKELIDLDAKRQEMDGRQPKNLVSVSRRLEGAGIGAKDVDDVDVTASDVIAALSSGASNRTTATYLAAYRACVATYLRALSTEIATMDVDDPAWKGRAHAKTKIEAHLMNCRIKVERNRVPKAMTDGQVGVLFVEAKIRDQNRYNRRHKGMKGRGVLAHPVMGETAVLRILEAAAPRVGEIAQFREHMMDSDGVIETISFEEYRKTAGVGARAQGVYRKKGGDIPIVIPEAAMGYWIDACREVFYRGRFQCPTCGAFTPARVMACRSCGQVEGLRFYHMKPLAVTVWIGKLMRRAGLPSKPHHFRHRMATRMANEGAGAWEIAHALGHNNVHTSQKYVDMAGMIKRHDAPVVETDEEGDGE